MSWTLPKDIFFVPLSSSILKFLLFWRSERGLSTACGYRGKGVDHGRNSTGWARECHSGALLLPDRKHREKHQPKPPIKHCFTIWLSWIIILPKESDLPETTETCQQKIAFRVKSPDFHICCNFDGQWVIVLENSEVIANGWWDFSGAMI